MYRQGAETVDKVIGGGRLEASRSSAISRGILASSLQPNDRKWHWGLNRNRPFKSCLPRHRRSRTYHGLLTSILPSFVGLLTATSGQHTSPPTQLQRAFSPSGRP